MLLKDLVGPERRVKFKQYRSGVLYYEIDNGFIFPVPVEDCGDTAFPSEDRAMLFMKWIKRQLNENKDGPVA